MVDFMQTTCTVILLLLSPLLFSQNKTSIVQTQAEVPDKLFSNPSLEVTQEKENIIKIKNKPFGTTQYYDISNHQDIRLQKSTVSSLTINLATIDTSQNILYSWWQTVPVIGNSPLQLKIIDSNHDGKKELFGYYVNVEHTTAPAETRVYQYDSNKTFSRVKEYGDSLWVRNFGDLENDGILDMIVRKDSSFRIDSNMFGLVTKTKIYSAKNSTSYLTEYKAEVSVGESLPRGTYFMDVDVTCPQFMYQC
jgi:hypothetical protein